LLLLRLLRLLLLQGVRMRVTLSVTTTAATNAVVAPFALLLLRRCHCPHESALPHFPLLVCCEPPPELLLQPPLQVGRQRRRRLRRMTGRRGHLQRLRRRLAALMVLLRLVMVPRHSRPDAIAFGRRCGSSSCKLVMVVLFVVASVAPAAAVASTAFTTSSAEVCEIGIAAVGCAVHELPRVGRLRHAHRGRFDLLASSRGAHGAATASSSASFVGGFGWCYTLTSTAATLAPASAAALGTTTATAAAAAPP